jgi:thiol-disulfide isomerase/thioredoxin
LRARRNPIDWKFKALDGREVDLTKLRGKIVLIDFWATWCLPCIAEMPELKALYDRYHAKGFEIIGVSLDSAADRGKLEKFVARQGMAWPQHFDGGGRRNAYAVQYGIKSVPTKILLDRDGRVAASRVPTDLLPAALAKMLPE